MNTSLMSVCEICNHEIEQGETSGVQTRNLVSALRMGYEPLQNIRVERPIQQLRENLWVLLEMHEPDWVVCGSCRDAVKGHADREMKNGPRPPESIHIFGNGFQPEPRQWRALVGAWLDKWAKKGIEMSVVGTPIGIEELPISRIEDFIQLIPRQSAQYRGRLVDGIILQDKGSHFELALLAVWSQEDSPLMTKMLRR